MRKIVCTFLSLYTVFSFFLIFVFDKQTRSELVASGSLVEAIKIELNKLFPLRSSLTRGLVQEMAAEYPEAVPGQAGEVPEHRQPRRQADLQADLKV
jgi:hypothetical protein